MRARWSANISLSALLYLHSTKFCMLYFHLNSVQCIFFNLSCTIFFDLWIFIEVCYLVSNCFKISPVPFSYLFWFHCVQRTNSECLQFLDLSRLVLRPSMWPILVYLDMCSLNAWKECLLCCCWAECSKNIGEVPLLVVFFSILADLLSHSSNCWERHIDVFHAKCECVYFSTSSISFCFIYFSAFLLICMPFGLLCFLGREGPLSLCNVPGKILNPEVQFIW